jgi:hypothetical protein
MRKPRSRKKPSVSNPLKEKEDRMAAWHKIETTIDRRTKQAPVSAERTWKRDDLYDRGER